MNENLPKSYTADFYTTFSSFSIFEFSIKKSVKMIRFDNLVYSGNKTKAVILVLLFLPKVSQEVTQ